MDLGLKDVHVLVTGASGGIGLEAVKLFLALGAKVTAHYNTHSASLETLAGHVRTVQANLTHEGDVTQMFLPDLTAGFGTVQVLVVNHGNWHTDDIPIAAMSLGQWKLTLDTNLTSSFLVVREYLRELEKANDALKEKACVVLIGSTAGKYGEAGHADYAASKSGVMYGLTNSLKNEIVKIAPKARVNCVAPGWVRTPMAETALKDPDTVYEALATTPLKKLAIPLDIANQIVVLSSSTVSGHVTGQVVMLDGGMEGRLLNRLADMSL